MSICGAGAAETDASLTDAVSVQRQMRELQTEAVRYQSAGDREQALAVIDRMVALDPEHPQPVALAVGLFFESRDFEAADELISGLGAGEAAVLLGRGYLSLLSKRREEALEQFQLSLQGYEERSHLAGQATAHGFLGAVQYGLKRFESARGEYAESRRLYERLEDTWALGSILGEAGLVEIELGETSNALAMQLEAVSFCERADSVGCQARTWRWIGKSRRKLGDHEGSREAFQHALDLDRELGLKSSIYNDLRSLAESYGALGAWDEAVEHSRQALVVAEEMGTAFRVARVRFELGKILRSARRYRESIEALRTAVGLYERGPTYRTRLAVALNELGASLIKAGEFAAAEDALLRAAEIAEEKNDTLLEARISANRSLVSAATGDLAQALVEQQRSLELYRETGDRDEQLAGWNNLGVIHHRLGYPERAKSHLETYLELARELSDVGAEARALANLGVVEMELGDLGAALEHQQAALGLQLQLGDPRAPAYTRFNLAHTLWETGQSKEATRVLKQAQAGFRQVHDFYGEVIAFNLSGYFARNEQDHRAALRAYDRSLELSEPMRLRRQERIAHEGRAAVLEATGKPEEAMREYFVAIDLVESLRARLGTAELKMAFLASRQDLYDRALALQIQLEGGAGRGAPGAFQLAERARARSMLDLLAESRASIRSTVDPSLLEREAALLDNVTSAAAELARVIESGGDKRSAQVALDLADGHLRSFTVELRRRVPRYGQLVYPEPVTLRVVRSQVLAADETLLYYHVGSEQSWIWIVDRNAARLHSLPASETIEALVRDFVAGAGSAGLSLGARPAGDAEAEALAKALLPESLPAGRRLLVAADGPLHRLPFGALRRDGRYLVQDHEIVVVPSATTLKLLRDRPVATAPGGFLGVGDPLTADPEFPSLPFSGQALERIAERFPESDRVLLTGEAATKKALEELPLDRFRYLHFATHGWVDAADRRRCGLLLSPTPEDEDDRILYFEEIFGMRMASDVVVLSTCRSGLGETLRGEGVIGLTRSFLYAGAQSVVATLWDVDDRSAGEFMELFYEELSRGRTPSGALRQAKLAFIESDRPARRQPNRWAPFVLVGDSRPTSIRMNPVSRAATLPDEGED